MNLSTKSRYGVRILTDIAMHQTEGPVQNADIAKRQGISLQYVVQIIRLLKSAHLIETTRGPKGGYLLSRPADTITCGQLVRLLETHSNLVACGQNSKVCKRSKDCQVRLVWMEATQALYEKLDAVSVADLATRIKNMSQGTCPRPKKILSRRRFPASDRTKSSFYSCPPS